MLPPLRPKPIKARARRHHLPVRREQPSKIVDGELRSSLRVLGTARPIRVILMARGETVLKGMS